jgi:hypothetical protein
MLFQTDPSRAPAACAATPGALAFAAAFAAARHPGLENRHDPDHGRLGLATPGAPAAAQSPVVPPERRATTDIADAGDPLCWNGSNAAGTSLIPSSADTAPEGSKPPPFARFAGRGLAAPGGRQCGRARRGFASVAASLGPAAERITNPKT